MSYKKIILFLSLFLSGFVCYSQQNSVYNAYIHQYKDVAIEQMNKHKIPASITLAQGLLESAAGQSKLARKANNHFGIKCGSTWKGKYVRHDDDKCGEKFRAYDSPIESYEDHSIFLTTRAHYAPLFSLELTDYKGWAKGLRDAYYAEDRQYHTKLVALIERYRLYEYDSYTMSDIKNGRKEGNPKSIALNRSIYKSNGLLYVTARQGDTFETLSKELGISKNKLISYNDLHKGYKIEEGDIIYLEKKRSKALEKYSFHRTRNGESLYRISQIYGIRLENLYKMNPQYSSYTRLKVGDVIRLR